jgi:SNF family Na+-dependent transporter
MPVPKRRWNPQHETLDQTDPDSSVYIEKQGEQDGLIRRVASGVQSHADDEDSGDIVQYLDIDEAIQRLGVGRFQHGIFLACGLCFAADAMEVLMLSFLAVVLQEEWNLTEGQTDSIISVVFAGALLGTLLLSTLGDIWGRCVYRPMNCLI